MYIGASPVPLSVPLHSSACTCRGTSTPACTANALISVVQLSNAHNDAVYWRERVSAACSSGCLACQAHASRDTRCCAGGTTATDDGQASYGASGGAYF